MSVWWLLLWCLVLAALDLAGFFGAALLNRTLGRRYTWYRSIEDWMFWVQVLVCLTALPFALVLSLGGWE